MKKAESDLTGKEHVNDAAEMAGWGVEEAQERNKKEASKCFPPSSTSNIKTPSTHYVFNSNGIF